MTSPHRYHSLAIVFHWLMAVGVAFMLGSGWYMVNADISKATQFDLYQIHKASGVLMLWAIVARIAVRLLTRQPALPDSIPDVQRKSANFGHIALYVALLVIPVAGWFMVSASPFGLPTFVFFDWLKWPHIPGVARNNMVEAVAQNTHWYSTLILSALIVIHLSAVYLHNKIHKVQLIKRVWWK